ncbi:MAG: hypothetical protein H0Z38_10045 [Firmicutes bacterium]|nr:hypothetical protein [Bacillota bacterium]
MLIFQPWWFGGYQLGFVILLVGAVIQVILGNLGPEANWRQALNMALLGGGIFAAILIIAIIMAPRLIALL